MSDIDRRNGQRIYSAASRRTAQVRTLSRSEAAAAHRRYVRTTASYAVVTAFCLVFCAVYEMFSFGENSLFMRIMFVLPLLLGALPFGLMAGAEIPLQVNRAAFNLWNAGVAVLVSGCLIRGIIEISGRVSDYDGYYWAAGCVMLLIALAGQAAEWIRFRFNYR